MQVKIRVTCLFLCLFCGDYPQIAALKNSKRQCIAATIWSKQNHKETKSRNNQHVPVCHILKWKEAGKRFLLWTSSAVTFHSGEDDDAAAATATTAAWLCAGELIREMNPQVKLLAGGGAAGVSHIASSCWRLPWRRLSRWDLQGCCFFSLFLACSPAVAPPEWDARHTHPSHRVTVAVWAKQMILWGWRLRNTCDFLCDPQTITQWLHPRRHYLLHLVPSFRLSSDVFIVLCLLSLYCLKLIFFIYFFASEPLFLKQVNQFFFSSSFETQTLFLF